MNPKKAPPKTGLEGATLLGIIKDPPEATTKQRRSRMPRRIVTRYGCGCRISCGYGNYSITYCAKHKAAPDMYEALVKFPNDVTWGSYTVEEIQRLIRMWRVVHKHKALDKARQRKYWGMYRCVNCASMLTETEVTTEGTEEMVCPFCHSSDMIRSGSDVEIIKER